MTPRRNCIRRRLPVRSSITCPSGQRRNGVAYRLPSRRSRRLGRRTVLRPRSSGVWRTASRSFAPYGMPCSGLRMRSSLKSRSKSLAPRVGIFTKSQGERIVLWTDLLQALCKEPRQFERQIFPCCAAWRRVPRRSQTGASIRPCAFACSDFELERGFYIHRHCHRRQTLTSRLDILQSLIHLCGRRRGRLRGRWRAERWNGIGCLRERRRCGKRQRPLPPIEPQTHNGKAGGVASPVTTVSLTAWHPSTRV